jgi:hypothetical protein
MGLGPLGLLRYGKNKSQQRLEEAIISADVSTRFKLDSLRPFSINISKVFIEPAHSILNVEN